jgi:TonB family protein
MILLILAKNYYGVQPSGFEQRLNSWQFELSSEINENTKIESAPKYNNASKKEQNHINSGPQDFVNLDSSEELSSYLTKINIEALPDSLLTYYSSEQLTKKPLVVHEEDLESKETHDIKANGKIILLLFIDEQGYVRSAKIERSDLPDVFSDAAVKAFTKFRFSPGEIDGVAVKSSMRIEVKYEDKF